METFVLVARMETVHVVVTIVAQHKWTMYHMDIKSAFLNGVLKEEMYVTQPPGYEIESQEDKVYRLKKALYGLKQAPCSWYNRIDAYLLDNGFNKCDCEPTLYIKESEGKILIVVLYVDDLIFTGSDDFLIADFKKVMKSEFEMTYMGLLRYFFGIEVKQTENGIFISQAKYVAEILERFKMQNSKSTPNPTVIGSKLSKEDYSSNVNPTLYKSMIGSLMYLTATRTDIMYAYGVLYTKTSDFRLVGYTDSNWAGNVNDRKSMSGYVFHLGSGAISWASKKQSIVSLSTAESKYVAATAAAYQAFWMRRMLKDLRHNQEGVTTIFSDNISGIALLKNSLFHKRTKHIDAKYHFIRELINNDEIVLQHCRSQEQFADIFTKPFAGESFVYLRNCLGIVNGGNFD
eukprot:PITA_18381